MTNSGPHRTDETVVVVDFQGGAEALRLALAIRQAGVFAALVRGEAGFTVPQGAKGLVLVGRGEADEGLVGDCVRSGLPLLSFGSPSLPLARVLGGGVGEIAMERSVKDLHFSQVGVFADVEGGYRLIDKASYLSLPSGCRILGGAEGVVLAFDEGRGKRTAVQFLPEPQDIDVSRMLANFLYKTVGAQAHYSLKRFELSAVEDLRARVGSGRALCLLSGGVDSSVAACLAQRALGAPFSCLLVDTGLQRQSEAEFVQALFADSLHCAVRRVELRTETLAALAGLTSAEEKRAAVEALINGCIERELAAMGEGAVLIRGIQATDLYTGDLPQPLSSGRPCLTPLAPLFKDEVRQLALQLGLPAEIAYRRHYPAAGIALRCLGVANAARLDALRAADALLQSHLAASSQARHVSQSFAVLTDVSAAFASPTPRYVIALRVVQNAQGERSTIARLSFDVLEGAAEEILAKVPGAYRVVYDLSACPPAAVEWE